MQALRFHGVCGGGWRKSDLDLKGWGDPPIVKTDYRERRKLDKSPDKEGHTGDPGSRSLVIREGHDRADITTEALVVGCGFQGVIFRT